MRRAVLHRIVRFYAQHRYGSPLRLEEENRSEFGDLAFAHGHEYAIRVSVSGEPAAGTGFVVDLPELDRALESVVAPLRGRDLNEEIPEVRTGEIQPSCEALADWIWNQLEGRLPPGARLEGIQVWESETLGAEVLRG
jgi:6-pyruvoyltetrahydropterin/6-carboxytetrahydropterin synthase